MSFVSVVWCQVEVSATGRSLVQGSPNLCGVSECYHEASIRRRSGSKREGCAMGKREHKTYSRLRSQFVLQPYLGRNEVLCAFSMWVYEHSVDFPFLSFIY